MRSCWSEIPSLARRSTLDRTGQAEMRRTPIFTGSGTPLAQKILEQCKNLPLKDGELVFHYSGCGKHITILDPFVGKSGALAAIRLSVTAIESEDHVLLAGICDDGVPLDADQCRRLFSRAASEANSPGAVDCRCKLQAQLDAQRESILAALGQRNTAYFEIELEKLEKWADDLKAGLECELKELDSEIKAIKRSAKLESSLDAKVALHRKAKELESERSRKRRSLFEAQDEIDRRKENLISDIEARLRQSVNTEELFTLKWQVD